MYSNYLYYHTTFVTRTSFLLQLPHMDWDAQVQLEQWLLGQEQRQMHGGKSFWSLRRGARVSQPLHAVQLHRQGCGVVKLFLI